MIYPFSGLLLSNKKDEVVIHAATWMNFAITVLSEEASDKRLGIV